MKKVIFLDDSKFVLKTISYTVNEMVANGDISVEYLDDSSDFVSRLYNEEIEFDILFLDINMPLYSGYDVCKVIRSIDRYKRAVIVALTTEITQESKKLGEAAGFSGWITKMNSPEVMKSTISVIIKSIINKEKE